MPAAAGADTTLSGIHAFFAAMLYYPDAQTKAQEELDRVLPGRLPELADEPDLPYVTALVREVLRWQPATPLGEFGFLHDDNQHSRINIADLPY